MLSQRVWMRWTIGGEVGSLVLAIALFCAGHHVHHARPTLTNPGWYSWFDQGYYLRAARALAHLDFSSAHQFYEPGYAVLAAPFVYLMPLDPFYIPNLISLLAACWLFGGVGECLLKSPWARPVCMALFVATTVAYPPIAVVWVVPWTTTPIAPLLFGALYATLRYIENPSPWPCFFAAFASCAIAAFRPGDAVVVVLCCAAAILWRPPKWRVVAAGIGGAACAIVPMLALHWAIWGLKLSPYMVSSGIIGFNLHLLPLRWVMIVVGPRPFTAGRGIAEVCPWVITGVAGMACFWGRKNALVIATAVLSMVLFLTYRDLHPTGLWANGNVHYFKWLLPVFALYSVLGAREIARRKWKVGVALAAAVALFCWQVDLRVENAAGEVIAPDRIELTRNLAIHNALLVRGVGDWRSIYYGYYRTQGNVYEATVDFKIYPRADGFLLMPLNPMRAGAVFDFAGYVFSPSSPPLLAKQVLRFGLPEW